MIKKFVSKQQFLELANERIIDRPGFVEGMHIGDAEMVGEILMMRGECFLKPDGGATEKSGPALEFYNKFAGEFSDEYGLLS